MWWDQTLKQTVQTVRSLPLEVLRIQWDVAQIYLLCLAFLQEEFELDDFLKSFPTYVFLSIPILWVFEELSAQPTH